MNNLKIKKAKFRWLPTRNNQNEAGFIIYYFNWLFWDITWTKDFEVEE